MPRCTKRHCAFHRQYIIAQLHAGDRTRNDWTEIQEDDYAVNVSTFMQKVTSKAVAPELVPEDLRLEVGKGVVVGGYVAS